MHKRRIIMKRLHLLFFFMVSTSAFVYSQIPSITSFTPLSGPIGTSVTIIGTNFSPTAENNIVFFGAARATVTSSSSSSLTVMVPVGATYASFTVTVGGLTGYSAYPFIVTFAGGSISFDPKVEFTTGSWPASVHISDLDGDGKSDLVTTNFGDSKVSVFRNISSIGNITSSSFAAKVDFETGFETCRFRYR